MIYTLDAEIMSTLEQYRLTESGTWSELPRDSWTLRSEDAKFDYYTKLRRQRDVAQRQGSVKLKGFNLTFAPENKPVSVFELAGSPHLFARTHRQRKPHLFTKSELVEVIAHGDDSRHNVLVINIIGYIKLGDQKYMSKARDQDIPVAVRNEMFCAENGYVGLEAARDMSHINRTYRTLLGGWYTHLLSGELDIFMDITPPESESELVAKIREATSSLQ